MKKFTLLFLSLFLLPFLSCEIETIENASLENQDSKENIANSVNLENLNEACMTVNLIAGQHHVAGNVSVYIDGENLIIVYTSNDDWTIDLTHLSVGNCDEDWVPLTGSGNPKVGRFEYTEPYSVTDHEVVYVISLEDLNDNYCFAAHAEVQGPTGGETAWAEGPAFEGNSWAMYVEGLLSDCDGEDPAY